MNRITKTAQNLALADGVNVATVVFNVATRAKKTRSLKAITSYIRFSFTYGGRAYILVEREGAYIIMTAAGSNTSEASVVLPSTAPTNEGTQVTLPMNQEWFSEGVVLQENTMTFNIPVWQMIQKYFPNIIDPWNYTDPVLIVGVTLTYE